MLNYDQIITFQNEVRTPDTSGGADVAWEDALQVRAEVAPIQGRELLNSQELEQITTHRIRMRHHPSHEIDVSMRVLWNTNNNKVLNIISCPDPGPRAVLREIIAQEGGAV